MSENITAEHRDERARWVQEMKEQQREFRRALAAARGAALEEAAQVAIEVGDTYRRGISQQVASDVALRVRALKSTPAPVTVSVDAVKCESRNAALEEAVDAARIARPPETMALSGRDKVVFNAGVRAAVERIRALKSTPEPAQECEGPADCGWHNGGPCEPCKNQERATVENGLLPAPRWCTCVGEVVAKEACPGRGGQGCQTPE